MRTHLQHLRPGCACLAVPPNRIVSPAALGFAFFLTVFPVGLATRPLGKDSLRLRFVPEAKAYLINRVRRALIPKPMEIQ